MGFANPGLDLTQSHQMASGRHGVAWPANWKQDFKNREKTTKKNAPSQMWYESY